MRFHGIGLESDRRLHPLLSFVRPALMIIQTSQGPVHAERQWIQMHRSLESWHSLLESSHDQQEIPKNLMGVGVAGVQVNRFFHQRQSFLPLPIKEEPQEAQ